MTNKELEEKIAALERENAQLREAGKLAATAEEKAQGAGVGYAGWIVRAPKPDTCKLCGIQFRKGVALVLYSEEMAVKVKEMQSDYPYLDIRYTDNLMLTPEAEQKATSMIDMISTPNIL